MKKKSPHWTIKNQEGLNCRTYFVYGQNSRTKYETENDIIINFRTCPKDKTFNCESELKSHIQFLRTTNSSFPSFLPFKVVLREQR